MNLYQLAGLAKLNGPTLTLVASGCLIATQWLTSNGDLFGEEAKPYIAIALTIVGGIYSLSALAAKESGSTSVSGTRALVATGILVTIQVLNSLIPVLNPYYQGMITDAIPVLQAMLASRWLREQSV